MRCFILPNAESWLRSGAVRMTPFALPRPAHARSSGRARVRRTTRLKELPALEAAKALGLTIPQSLLLRADEVIR
jgi:hypothetical protein